MRQRMGREVASLGLTAQQAAVVLVLSDGPMPISHVAERLGIDRPTMTGLAARLERDGWIARSANPADRRSALLGLAARATGALPSLRSAAAAVNDNALRELSADERTQLFDLLNRLIATLED